MKKLFTIVALAATSFIFAQDNTDSSNAPKKVTTISGMGMFSDPSQFGLSFEFQGLMCGHGHSKKSTQLVNLSFGVMEYDSGVINNINGQGGVIEIGSRQYYSKGDKLEGLYTSNYLSYGNIRFDQDFLEGKFEGNYSYFSFFSPELGYKMVFGNFTVDPFIGATWKIEIKGKGDIDNKNVDEWAPRAGIKLGFMF